jgi:hypothetical protein
MIFAVAAAAPLAGANSTGRPVAHGEYNTTATAFPQYSVTVEVLSSPTEVIPQLDCSPSRTDQFAWQWVGPAISVHLHKNAFSLDERVSLIRSSARGSLSRTKGTVLLTGRFAGGRFVGTAQIAGSSCPRATYTATLGGINHLE